MADVTVRGKFPEEESWFEVTGNPSDSAVIGVIERTGAYEPDVMLGIRHVLPPDAVCIDGGANIGVQSLAMAHYAPRSHIYAFEPGAENFLYLQGNLAAGGLGDERVTPLRLGLWDSAGSLKLNFEAAHAGGAYVGDIGDSHSTSEAIDLVTLDDWVESEGLSRLDFIKLDIEGAEPHALAGARRTIARFRPALLIEWNPPALARERGYDFWRLFSDLRAMYPVVSYVREDGTTVWLESRFQASRVLMRKGFVDLLCLPSRGGVAVRAAEIGRAVKESALLARRFNRFRPPDRAFMYAPSYRASFAVDRLELAAGSSAHVDVRVVNTSSMWLSSAYAEHPIMASYHWARPDGTVVSRDGLRTVLAAPIRPGRSEVVRLSVAAPSGVGAYVLQFCLVQERFAWADQIRPDLVVGLPVEVVS
jgi:FkbM family methyltransferase